MVCRRRLAPVQVVVAATRAKPTRFPSRRPPRVLRVRSRTQSRRRLPLCADAPTTRNPPPVAMATSATRTRAQLRMLGPLAPSSAPPRHPSVRAAPRRPGLHLQAVPSRPWEHLAASGTRSLRRKLVSEACAERADSKASWVKPVWMTLKRDRGRRPRLATSGSLARLSQGSQVDPGWRPARTGL
jgi:hypothetical protein